jgi:hypothetical protein
MNDELIELINAAREAAYEMDTQLPSLCGCMADKDYNNFIKAQERLDIAVAAIAESTRKRTYQKWLDACNRGFHFAADGSGIDGVKDVKAIEEASKIWEDYISFLNGGDN